MIIHKQSMTDDPSRRKPDIKRAKQYLNWEPKVSIQNTHCLNACLITSILRASRRRGGLMDNVSALQPQDHGFKPHTGLNHDS